MKRKRSQPAKKKAHGGTLIGMFIGLVIGVGIAAAVSEICLAVHFDGLLDKRVIVCRLDAAPPQVLLGRVNQPLQFRIERGIVAADAQPLLHKVKHDLHLAG